MKNFITKIKVLNPLFIIKLTNVNLLVRKLRKAGDFTIEYVDFNGKEPVLSLIVANCNLIYNAGISNSIIKNIDGQIVHESVVGGVLLRWRADNQKHYTLSSREKGRRERVYRKQQQAQLGVL